jgi:hypothetical protein
VDYVHTLPVLVDGSSGEVTLSFVNILRVRRAALTWLRATRRHVSSNVQQVNHVSSGDKGTSYVLYLRLLLTV